MGFRVSPYGARGKKQTGSDRAGKMTIEMVKLSDARLFDHSELGSQPYDK